MKKIRLIEEMPRWVPYAQRFRAEQVVLGREVELRLPPEDVSPRGLDLFRGELDDLVLLDHPGFLPILDRGVTRGRPFYVVPLRESHRLAELRAGGDLDLEERCEVVRGLAGALAELHLIETCLGALRADQIAWDRDKSVVHFLHHRSGRHPVPADLPPDPPSDVTAEDPSPRADLFLWAHFAYSLLTDGASPFTEGADTPMPVRTPCPNLAPGLAHAIEACLARDPGVRPAHAAELHAVLQLSSRNVVPDEELSSDHSTTIPTVRLEESIMDLRSSGRIPEPRQRPVAPPLEEVGEPMSQGAFLAAVVGVLTLGFVVGVSLPRWLAPANPPEGPARRIAGHPASSPTPEPEDEGLVELAPSTQSRYREDRRIRKLLTGVPASPETFMDHWKTLRDLSLGKGLPPQLDDQRRILAIRRRFKADPAGGCAALDAYVRDLATVLGVEGGDEG